MKVSGSERLSDFHKIFITIKIFDSMKRYLIIIALFLGFVACAPKSALDVSAKLSVAENKIEAKAAKESKLRF